MYALLVVPWPGVMDGYRACFRAGGNLVFRTFGSTGSATFQPVPAIRMGNDTRITLRKRRPPYPETDIDIQSVLIGYRPTVFVIALSLATPIAWSRRWRSLVWGLVGVQVFIIFRVGLLILDSFSNANVLAIYSFGPFFKGLLSVVSTILVRSPAMHYMGPMFVWLLVTFRRGDLREIFAEPDRPTTRAGRRSARSQRRK